MPNQSGVNDKTARYNMCTDEEEDADDANTEVQREDLPLPDEFMTPQKQNATKASNSILTFSAQIELKKEMQEHKHLHETKKMRNS